MFDLFARLRLVFFFRFVGPQDIRERKLASEESLWNKLSGRECSVSGPHSEARKRSEN